MKTFKEYRCETKGLSSPIYVKNMEQKLRDREASQA